MKVLRMVGISYRKLFNTERPYLILILMLVLLWGYTQPMIRFSVQQDAPMQIFEPFISLFTTMTITLFPMLGLLFLLNDAPFIEDDTLYVLTRSSKVAWAAAQILYMVSLIIIYYFLILSTTCLMSAGRAYLDNRWSETAYLLSSTQAATVENVPIFIDAGILWSTLPLHAMIHTFVLACLYGCFVGMLLFLINLLSGKLIGFGVILFVHVLSYILAYATPNTDFYYLSPHLMSLLANYQFGTGYGLQLPYGYAVLILINSLLIGCILAVCKKKEDYITKEGQSR